MKRLVLIALVIIMTVSMSMSVYAANNSPGHHDAPPSGPAAVNDEGDLIVKSDEVISDVVVKAASLNDDVSIKLPTNYGIAEIEAADQRRAYLIVTPLPLKSTIISAESRKEIDIAYDDIINNGGYRKLKEKLEEMSKTHSLEKSEIVAAMLFDVTYYEENMSTHVLHESDNHGAVTIEVPNDVLSHFVALLHYYNGEWTVVENARVVGDRELQFSVDEFSPFVIVIDNETPDSGYSDSEMQSPKTDDPGFPWGALAGMIICLIGGGLCFAKIVTHLTHRVE